MQGGRQRRHSEPVFRPGSSSPKRCSFLEQKGSRVVERHDYTHVGLSVTRPLWGLVESPSVRALKAVSRRVMVSGGIRNKETRALFGAFDIAMVRCIQGEPNGPPAFTRSNRLLQFAIIIIKFYFSSTI